MAESKITGFDEYYNQRTTRERKVRVLTLNQVKTSYDNMFNSVYVLLDKARQNRKYGTIAFMKSLKKEAQKIVDKFADDYERNLRKKCALLANYSIRSEMKDIKDFGVKSQADPSGYINIIDLYIEELMNYVYAQKDRMIGQIWSVVLSDVIKMHKIMRSNSVSRRQAMEISVNGEKLNLKFFFVDRINRKKNASSYFEMLTSSIMQQIELDSYIYAMLADGVDLAMILECEGESGCSQYNGLVISVTGQSKNHPSFDEIIKEKKIWHPYCSHLITVIEEQNEPN